jgi:hypothetical protein
MNTYFVLSNRNNVFYYYQKMYVIVAKKIQKCIFILSKLQITF